MYIVHEEPTIISEDQYIAMVDLASFGFAGLLEQVWLGPCGDGLFQLQCIPFRFYGASLFDIARVDEEGFLVEIVRLRGHRTLRGLIAPNVVDLADIRKTIMSLAETAGLLLEWSGDRHVAIDVPLGSSFVDLLDFFREQRKAERVYWEWSDVKPFSVAGEPH
ncbi:DUF4265 domain-containing protein [Actinomadura bangladeshensis]|nr:DUF4265 domain-containing protein [Actinomadura bangladeshensis]